MYKLIHGDSREELRGVPDNSVDSVITDPPYELSFMGAKWDSTGIAYDPEFWAECLRILKPGGLLLSFGAPRTYHRIAVGIEDAGFEIREGLMWVYGSGMPHGQNISKAIDRKLGAKRSQIRGRGGLNNYPFRNDDGWSKIGEKEPLMDSEIPVTDEAKRWKGWNTGLKPAYEPIVLAQKPREGSFVNNVLKHGVGGMNIDACRVSSSDEYIINRFTGGAKPWGDAVGEDYESVTETKGRWPANFILDEEAASVLDKQVGKTSKGIIPSRYFKTIPNETEENDRFFYSGKVSKKERRGSTHTTMKPLALMRYLARLVTPPDGTILDPFMGSGTTGEAALLEGFKFIGIEKEEEYFNFSYDRLLGAANEIEQLLDKK